MSNVCILSFKPLANDPRIYRQVKWLEPHYSLFTLGPADTAITNVQCVDMGYRSQSKLKKAGRAVHLLSQQHEAFYWGAPHVRHSWRRLQQLKPDIIIANELECWPLAVKAKQTWGCKILLDAHEFYPGMYSQDPKWRLLFGAFTRAMCRNTLPHADVITTVSKSLCQYYEKDFGCLPELIMNAPFYEDLPVYHNNSNTVRLIHHGHPMPDRSPDILIDAMKYVNKNVELTFMFKVKTDQQGYYDFLRQKAANDPRIHFIDPVPMQKISRAINHFDAGIHLLPPINPNHEGALPNKLFEFIQARLAVVFSPTQEVSRVIKAHDLGIVSKGFNAQSLGEAINDLTPERIRHYKEQAHKTSKVFCAEKSGEHFLQLVKQMETSTAP